MENETEKQG